MERPGWDEYFLGIARAVAARADCTRRQVGAVIVDEDHRILATGYNGSEPGGPSCLKGECPRGRHYPGKERWPDGDTRIDVCACGKDWPCPDAVAPGSSYDTGAGTCHSTHAESNALLFARASVKGATLFVTSDPCGGCSRLIKSAGIARVVTPESLMKERGDERDPKFVEHNKNLYPIEDPPLCERKGCGHYVERHWDPEKKVHAACLTGCGCPGLLD
jgi:dCMP deaminase